MITILEGYPDDVLAVAATGKVTADDYHKVLIPEAEARLRKHDKIRVIYRIGKGAEGFSAGAMLADATFGVGHLRNLGRTALVTDVAWIADAAKLFAPFFHVLFRVFPDAAFNEARDWVLAAGDKS